MIYLHNMRINLNEHFNLSKSLTNQQKIVYAVACAVFTAICAYSIYRLYRACCLKKEQLPPADQKTKEAAEKQLPAKDIENKDEVIPKEEPVIAKPARKALDINAPLGTDWTLEEIKAVSQAIPQWLKGHLNDPTPDVTIVEEAFVSSYCKIEDADELDECQKKFNLQLEACAKILSAHSNMEPRHNMKVPKMLRALHISQDCSETERMAYTYIMAKAWTTIVREGEDNNCYPYIVRDGGCISEDSFKILQEAVEANKTHPKTAAALASFAPAHWQPCPTPKFSYANVLGNVITDITKG